MKPWSSFLTRTALGVGLLYVSAGSHPTGATSASDQPFVLGSKHILLETPTQISPPAIQFTGQDIHVAWFEKNGAANQNQVKLVRMAATGETTPAVIANGDGQRPAAIHQAPGLAAGQDGSVYLTWSAPPASANAGMFASDLLLARSKDGGATFLKPTVVNDDGKAISHSFEDVLV
jgi:hypothetical protein